MRDTPRLTASELAYLRRQSLGRLATVDADGAPQNNPVSFFADETGRHVDIGGYTMGASRKFRNAQRNPRVALVVDDIASVNPWRVRGIEIRGTAEALTDVDPPHPQMSRELLRITPDWIGTWGIDEHGSGLTVRR